MSIDKEFQIRDVYIPQQEFLPEFINIQKTLAKLAILEEHIHKPFIGISLGNPFFKDTKNLKHYIQWALKYTVEGSHLPILIADTIHLLNILYRDGENPQKADNTLKKVVSKEDEIIKMVLDELQPELAERVKIYHWEDVVVSEKYKKNIEIIMDAFKNNAIFHKEIMDLVQRLIIDNIGSEYTTKKQTAVKYKEKLCEYFLNEFALLVGGLEIPVINNERKNVAGNIYQLLPYPYLDKPQELLVEIPRGKHPDIAKNLITHGTEILPIALNKGQDGEDDMGDLEKIRSAFKDMVHSARG